MTSFDGNDLNDHVRNPKHRSNYLAIYPKSPTDEHPDVQLRLMHGRSTQKDGYVNSTPRAVPIRLLEPYNGGGLSRYEIGYYRLTEESIKILITKSGYSSSEGTTASNSKPSPAAGASQHVPLVPMKKAAFVDGKTTQTDSRTKAESGVEGNPEFEIPCLEGEQAAPAPHSWWLSRVFETLAKFMYVDPLSDLEIASFITHGSPSTLGTGRDSCSSPENLIDDAITIELEHHTTVSQILRSLLFVPSLSFYNPGCSFPRVLFNGIIFHASSLSLFPRLGTSVPVELTLYYATKSLHYTFIPSGRSPGERRILITKTRSILIFVYLPKNGS